MSMVEKSVGNGLNLLALHSGPCGISHWVPLYISLRHSYEFALEMADSAESAWISLVRLSFLPLSPWWGLSWLK